MTVTFELTEEQTDALNERVALFNAGSGEAEITVEQFLADNVIMESVNTYVKTAYDNAVSQLGVLAPNLDYASRKAIITQVKSQLND